MLGLCFAVFFVITLGKRELVALRCYVLNAMSLFSFFDFSSQCNRLVCVV